MASKKNNESDDERHSLKSDSHMMGEAWNPKKKKTRQSAGDEIMTIHSSDDDNENNVKENETAEEEHSDHNGVILDSKDSDNEYSHGPTTARRRRISEDDSVNQRFISIKDLHRLPRIEPNSRGNFYGSFHRYEKPISNLKLRVRLLKYPSLTQRNKWGDNLLVLEDRVLSWQEKVFSKTEVAYLMDKPSVMTSLDEKYRREILSNKESIGKYFYTYVESDFSADNKWDHHERTVVRRCAALHSKKSRKFNGSTADKSINSDGESVVDDPSDADEYKRSLISKKSMHPSEGSLAEILTPGGRLSRSVENLSEETLKTLRKKKDDERVQREKQVKKDASEKTKIEREDKLKKEKEIKDAIKKGRKELKEDLKRKRFKELERQKKEKDEEYMKMWAGSKRPSLALEAHMKLGMTPVKTPKLVKKKRQAEAFTKRKGKSVDSETNGEDDDGDWNTQDEENESDTEYSKQERKLKLKKDENRRKSSGKAVDEILEPPSNRKSQRKEKRSKQSSGREHSVSAEADVVEKTEKHKIMQPGYKYSRSRIVRSRSKSFWALGSRNISTGISSLVEAPQSMIVKVVIPHMTKKRRDLTVCAIKVYLQSESIALKPSFGYRIIEAKRNHVYRISWELHSDRIPPSKDKRSNLIGKEVKHLSEENVLSSDDFLFGDIGDMFEVVPLNEMRLVVMGEILSAKGFEDWPICVHYIVEIPKGWRNDSVSSNLHGITHNSYTTPENVAHFSHDFFFQLVLSLESIEEQKMPQTPLLLFMVASIVSPIRVKYEGYGYIALPSQPGVHHIEIKTWKPKPRTILDKMNKCFLNISPSLQDIRAVHIPCYEDEDCSRANRLGLETEPSGSIMLRLNILRQTPSHIRDQKSKLELLEKMSSSTILKSVQAVIDAFQRARNRAMKVKNTRSENKQVL